MTTAPTPYIATCNCGFSMAFILQIDDKRYLFKCESCHFTQEMTPSVIDADESLALLACPTGRCEN